MNTITPSLLPSKSSLYEFVSTENKVENKHSILKHKFKWRDKEYCISWDNPQGVISEADAKKYVTRQLDKILVLVERHLYGNNKYLKSSLDLDRIDVIKKRSNGTEKEIRVPNPFNLQPEIKNISEVKLKDNALDKLKRQSLEDKLKHAQEAQKMLEVIGKTAPQKNNNDAGLDKLGHLKIEKSDSDKVTVSYGPFGYLWKLGTDLVKWIFEAVKGIIAKISSLKKP